MARQESRRQAADAYQCQSFKHMHRQGYHIAARCVQTACDGQGRPSWPDGGQWNCRDAGAIYRAPTPLGESPVKEKEAVGRRARPRSRGVGPHEERYLSCGRRRALAASGDRACGRRGSGRGARRRCRAGLRAAARAARADSRAICFITAMNSSSVSLVSVSVGSIIMRLGHDQREVDRRRMDAEVEQALGDVERVDVLPFLPICREDELVHAGAVEGQVVVGLQGAHDVVGVEDGALADVAQAVGAVAADDRCRRGRGRGSCRSWRGRGQWRAVRRPASGSRLWPWWAAGPGRKGTRCAATPTGPAPGPPPPWGVLHVLCRLKWTTSKPMSPGRTMPMMALALAPS